MCADGLCLFILISASEIDSRFSLGNVGSEDDMATAANRRGNFSCAEFAASFQLPVALSHGCTSDCYWTTARSAFDLDIFCLRLRDRTSGNTVPNVIHRCNSWFQVRGGVRTGNTIRWRT